MEHKIAQFGNKGMSQDTSISKSSNELVFENRNIRITAREDGTLLSVTNEIGPNECVGPDAQQIEIQGVYYGYCDCGDSIVLFSQEDNNSIICKLFYNGYLFSIDYLINDEDSINLNFSAPIEATFYYEREDVQKVYWVDGVNPVRVINIAASQEEMQSWDESSFDFVPVVDSIPSVNISKTYGGAGLFPAGVIQYFLSYYNKYGQESKIIQASDLNYISFQDRGAKPDETVNCNFEITLSDLDQSFDYVRIYSAKRTAVDGPLEVHIVADVPVSSGTVTVIDTNLNQEAVDSSLLYFIGGDAFIASTIEQKDNVLFLGDIESKVPVLTNVEIETIRSYFDEHPIQSSLKSLTYASDDIYTYDSQIKKSSTNIKGFKFGEYYRIGLQLQDQYGQWTEPFYVQDIEITTKPEIINGNWYIPSLECNTGSIETVINTTKYPRYMFVMVESNNSTRKILAQGIINPTIFNAKERREGRCYGFASWITRPFNSNVKHKHMESLGPNTESNSEIQNIANKYLLSVFYDDAETYAAVKSQDEQYYIDNSLLTLNSPEIAYDKVQHIDNCNFRFCGIVKVSNWYEDFILEADNIAGDEFITYKSEPYGNITTRPIRFKDKKMNNDGSTLSSSYVDYYGYLFQKKGSLIGQTSLDTNQNSFYTTLKHKLTAYYTLGSLQKYFVGLEKSLRIKDIWKGENLVKLTDRLYYSGSYQKLSVAEEPYKVQYLGGSLNVDQLDPVYIKSSQSLHAVFGFDYQTDSQHSGQYWLPILPGINGLADCPYVFEPSGDFNYNSNPQNPQYEWGGSRNPDILDAAFLWKDVLDDYVNYIPSTINLGDISTDFPLQTPFLFLGEFVRSNINSAEDLYGDYSLENLKKYKWIPITKTLNSLAEESSDAEIFEGDTYFQKWECLRTYPTTENDENSVIDIVSFMVETHINLDGRDDINRGPYNLLTKRPTNTNLFNDVYNQTNNIFEYNITDLASSESGEVISKFSNQFAWSLAKSPLQQVDVWTNITMSAIQQVNGQYGPINEITKLGDTLVLFQDHAICTIDFNNRTQISTEQGLPIELANSGKVQGVSYITTMYGCKNKHSIVNTKTGIYFIDDNNQAFLNISKEGIKDVSTSAGMSVWFTKNVDFGSKWTGGLLNNGFVCKYDEKFGDIYIMNNDNCIVYNELLQTFTSFFDTYRYPGMWNLNKNLFALGGPDNTNVKVYMLFAGDYSSNYSITYKVNPEPYTDKIFTNLDLIADRYDNSSSPDDVPDDEHGILDTSVLPFTNIKVWNEYQNTGDVTLTEEKYTPSIYKNKFRIRHIQLPRCIKADSKYKLDRIRNPWTFIKLSSSGDSTSKLQYHNMTVHYYE